MIKAVFLLAVIFGGIVWLIPASPAASVSPAAVSQAASSTSVTAQAAKPTATVAKTAAPAKTTALAAAIPNVPLFSQFRDILSPQWQGVGCGITSLAMVIDYYDPHAVTVNALLQEGISAGAYDEAAGWTYDGLIRLSERYGLAGTYYDLAQMNAAAAVAKFRKILQGGPVILAVHNRLNPASAVPHLVVVDGISGNTVYYNDPGVASGKRKVSVAGLLDGWKGKVIAIRPAPNGGGNGLSLK